MVSLADVYFPDKQPRTEWIRVELRRACSLSKGLRLAEDMSKSLTCDNGSAVRFAVFFKQYPLTKTTVCLSDKEAE